MAADGRAYSWDERLTGELATADVETALASLLTSVAEFSSAEMAAVAIFVGDDQLVVRAVTPGLEAYLSQPFPVTPGSLSADAMAKGTPLARSGPFGWQEDGPADFVAAHIVAVPLVGRRVTPGLLYVGRRGDERPFSEAEVAIAARFAHHAALALEVLRDRDEREVLDLLERHQVTASSLGDEALQELYALALQVDRLATRIPADAVADVEAIRSRLDSVSAKLRRMMADHAWPSHDCGPLRQRVSLAVESASHRLGADVTLVVTGDLDMVPSGRLADDLVASLRELLDEVGQSVTDVAVDVTCRPASGSEPGVGALSVTVSCSHPPTSSALRDASSAIPAVRRRARRHGGHLDVARRSGEGWTRALWTVPLLAADRVPSGVACEG